MSFFYSLMLTLLFSSCVFDPKQEGIDVFNNTDSIVYVAYSFSDSLISNYPFVLFKDVSCGNEKIKYQSPCYRLNAYSFGCIGIFGRETLLQKCNNKTLRLFFIPESVVREKSFSEICKYQLYEKN